MFGIGFTELILIAVLALMVLGPERMPELARKLGQTVRDLRRMYANLRAELGPDFDEIEQGIRDLRSLDPRQQIRDYGRDLLNDVTTDAPELKQLAGAPKLDVERLGRKVLRDELLERPLAESTVAPAATPVPAATPGPSGDEDELLQTLLARSAVPEYVAASRSNGRRASLTQVTAPPPADANGHAPEGADGPAVAETQPAAAGVSDHGRPA